ncbi:MAG: hypothetical protein IPH72_19075 [Sandaracinaceae bacterium]|nr:hypothetical protein [Sandaracinaceae bacterium]
MLAANNAGSVVTRVAITDAAALPPAVPVVRDAMGLPVWHRVHVARRGAGLPALPQRLPTRAAHRREREAVAGTDVGFVMTTVAHRRGAHRRA